jgi:7,8-dihydropterin-6-yl-methyl-4-(beta-D-ribofuranosyl)aminobenzene 5'-phosphate synthase
MIQDIRITILIEDTCDSPQLSCEHGLSLWLELDDKLILFDTGQSELFLKNAEILGVDLSGTDAIVLSHGHYDHTGGLPAIADIALDAKVYLHPEAAKQKFSRKTFGAKPIGMSDSTQKALEKYDLVLTDKITPVCDGVYVTGQVLRLNGFEDVGGAFFLDENCRTPDKMADDQTLFIESKKGLVVVFGCAHAGVINILDHISNFTNQNHIYAVIGGMHLLNANEDRIAKTIETLEKYKVRKIMPLHCTGAEAVGSLKKAFGDKCFILHTGDAAVFP